MKKFIVLTTIQEPTEATIKFSKKEDWTLVVVGDTKTPHEEYEKINCVYLHPDKQDELYPELSKALGWKTIQRRNVGFVYAYDQGADVVATVDDDNIPYDNWGDNLIVGKEVSVDVWECENGFFDPLSVTDDNYLWHRGYPIEKVKTKNNVNYLGEQKRKVLIQADLWDGDPDIDAMCRLPHRPVVKYNIEKPFGSNQLSPFNSQNTFIARELLPYYMVLPFVGRMDDIWGGYQLYDICNRRDFVAYCKASVYQDRNEQDLVTNLEKEVIGYRETLNFITGEKTLDDISKESSECYSIYRRCFK